MDFLDPKKLHAHRVRLLVGYGLVVIAMLLALIILLYQAYGFGVNNGQIVQNGLAFFSSHPSGATVSIDGASRGQTDNRLELPAGSYDVTLSKPGYSSWQRKVAIIGGEVERFYYPFLFPANLVTKTSASFAKAPALATESPNNRWIITQQPDSLLNFTLYDVSSPSVASSTLTIPANILTASNAKQSLQVVEWSTDNRHVLLKHVYGKSYEYILLDIVNPAKSLNLNAALGTSPSELTLANKAYNSYFVYDSDTHTLSTASLGSQHLAPLLKNVADYVTYNGSVLYVQTGQDNDGNSEVLLYQNGESYPIQRVKFGDTYLLDITQFNGNWFVVAGARSVGEINVYENPVTNLSNYPSRPLQPVTVLRIKDADYEKFSPNAQYLAVESGNNFVMYDVAYHEVYNFTLADKLEKPQTHGQWMTNGQFCYVSEGQLVVFEFDGTNVHHLMAASPDYEPFFDTNYNYAYTLAPNTDKVSQAAAPVLLTQTALLTPADL